MTPNDRGSPDRAQAVTRGSIASDLRGLGLAADAVLMVHASMRKIGPVVGGADAVLDAIRDAIGPGGTLVMPLGSDDEDPFDPLHSPADEDIGVLAEVFRRRPTTRVNDHPAARFGASGPLASEILEPIPLHDYYGPGSPLARFAAIGQVLRLGANPDTVTVTHHAEYLATMPAKRRVRRHYRRADGTEVWVESLDDSDGIVEPADYFHTIWLDYAASGGAARGRVGNCDAELFSASGFVDFAVRWLESRL